MAMLVLLNGPPASGKSTVAAHLVERRPLSINLDIDVVRGLLGRWADDPLEAGLAARDLALAICRTQLTAGRDVVVPQFLGRVEFIEALDRVAVECDADFVEVALMIDRHEAAVAFAERRATPESRAHHDAALLVDRSTSADPVGEMFDAFVDTIGTRPATIRVPARRGEVAGTVALVELALQRAERNPSTTLRGRSG